MLPSTEVGDRFAVSVALPHRYESSTGPYPVLVVLDAHWLYGTVRDLALSLAMARAIPRCVVVGVGYPTTDLGEIDALRQRDATPTSAPFPEGTRFGPESGRYGTGGAERFRAFLTRELRPWLAERYRTDGAWVLVGHSFTALFGVATLLDEPSAFDAYLLASPSLWWDSRAMLRPERLAEGRPFQGRVYLSVGGDEDRDDTSSTFRMRAGATTLAEHLSDRAGEGLDVRFEVLDGETHHSTTGPAVSRGLRALLG